MKGRITKDGFEQSQLLIGDDIAKGKVIVHRDYLAHIYRWQYVLKWLAKGKRYEDTHVLDVGCGVDTPLYLALHGNRRIPRHYTGVDIAKINGPKAQCRGEKTFLSHTPIHTVEVADYNLITCFEMLEHVPLEYAMTTFKHLHSVSTDDATFILSTPVFDEKVGAASNHINEMTREQVIKGLTDAGWNIDANYGTFASIKDYKKHLSEAELELFEKLQSYYHSDVLATIFAPLYPEYSRNNLWVCTKAESNNNPGEE